MACEVCGTSKPTPAAPSAIVAPSAVPSAAASAAPSAQQHSPNRPQPLPLPLPPQQPLTSHALPCAAPLSPRSAASSLGDVGTCRKRGRDHCLTTVPADAGSWRGLSRNYGAAQAATNSPPTCRGNERPTTNWFCRACRGKKAKHECGKARAYKTDEIAIARARLELEQGSLVSRRKRSQAADKAEAHLAEVLVSACPACHGRHRAHTCGQGQARSIVAAASVLGLGE